MSNNRYDVIIIGTALAAGPSLATWPPLLSES